MSDNKDENVFVVVKDTAVTDSADLELEIDQPIQNNAVEAKTTEGVANDENTTAMVINQIMSLNYVAMFDVVKKIKQRLLTDDCIKERISNAHNNFKIHNNPLYDLFIIIGPLIIFLMTYSYDARKNNINTQNCEVGDSGVYAIVILCLSLSAFCVIVQWCRYLTKACYPREISSNYIDDVRKYVQYDNIFNIGHKMDKFIRKPYNLFANTTKYCYISLFCSYALLSLWLLNDDIKNHGNTECAIGLTYWVLYSILLNMGTLCYLIYRCGQRVLDTMNML